MEDNTHEINQHTGESDKKMVNYERIFTRNRGENEILVKCLIGIQEDDFREKKQ